MTKNLFSIQIARAVAAILVAIYHFEPHLNATFHRFVLTFFTSFAYIGVEIFFVISGFVAFYSSKNLQAETQSAWPFLRKRLLRIYPIYWLYLFIYCLFLLWRNENLQQIRFFSSIFLLPQDLPTQVLKVAWSLVLELYFYVLFALLLYCKPQQRFTILAKYCALMVSIYALIVLFFPALTAHIPDALLPYLSAFTSPYLFEFLLGVGLAHFYVNQRTRYLFEKIKTTFILIPIITLIILVSIISYLFAHQITTDAITFFLFYRIPLFGSAALLLIIIFIMLENYWQKNHHIKYIKYALWLGNGSYSIYLLHTIIYEVIYATGLRQIAKHLNQFSYDILGTFLMLFLFLLSIFCSAWLGNYLEKPFYDYLIKRLIIAPKITKI